MRGETATGTASVWVRNRDRALGWLIAQRVAIPDYMIVLGLFAAVWVGRIILHQLFYPDSAHYLAMSLWFSGMSRHDALETVMQRSLAAGYEPNTSEALLFDWGLVRPRVVLPAIAVPFIWAFGPNGLAVATGLITLALLLALYLTIRSFYGRSAALVVTLLTETSAFIMSFFVGMLTESLSALWGLIALLLVYRYLRRPHWGLLVGLVAVTVLSAFTRQATLIVAGAFFVAWLGSAILEHRPRRWLAPMLAVVISSIGVQVLQTVLFPFSQLDQFYRMTGTDNLWSALLATPGLIKHLVHDDFVAFVQGDPAILAILGISCISIVLFWRRTESHLLLGAMIAIAIYNITNGNATQFRYALPGYVFYAASIGLVVARIAGLRSENRPGVPERLGIPTGASRRS